MLVYFAIIFFSQTQVQNANGRSHKIVDSDVVVSLKLNKACS